MNDTQWADPINEQVLLNHRKIQKQIIISVQMCLRLDMLPKSIVFWLRISEGQGREVGHMPAEAQQSRGLWSKVNNPFA